MARQVHSPRARASEPSSRLRLLPRSRSGSPAAALGAFPAPRSRSRSDTFRSRCSRFEERSRTLPAARALGLLLLLLLILLRSPPVMPSRSCRGPPIGRAGSKNTLRGALPFKSSPFGFDNDNDNGLWGRRATRLGLGLGLDWASGRGSGLALGCHCASQSPYPLRAFFFLSRPFIQFACAITASLPPRACW